MFFQNLVVRQIRQDYLENLTGFAWLILQPLILLAVYAFVFSTIFKARIPEAEDIGFVPYLAIAFWPWTAFSEAVLRANNSITANGCTDRQSGICDRANSTGHRYRDFHHAHDRLPGRADRFAVDGHESFSGYTCSLVIPVILLMWVFACAISLFTSAIQVFVRDLAQILPPLMTFWFFTTPILYSSSHLPESIQKLTQWNPMAWFIARLRELLLFGEMNFDYKALADGAVYWPVCMGVPTVFPPFFRTL